MPGPMRIKKTVLKRHLLVKGVRLSHLISSYNFAEKAKFLKGLLVSFNQVGQRFKRGLKFVWSGLSLSQLMICTSCCFNDPSSIGDTAYCPELRFEPYCIPILPQDRLEENEIDLKKRLSLCNLVDLALRNNPLTQLSWRQARAAAYEVGVRESELYPQIALNESLDFVKSVTGTSSTTTATTAVGFPVDPNQGATSATLGVETNTSGYAQLVTTDLSLNYLLLDFGGRFANIESAKFALLSANWSHNRVLQGVILDTLNAYYEHQNALSNLDARLDDLEDAKKSFESAQSQYEAGIRPKVDVLQAQSTLANAELQLETVRGQVKTSLGRLAKAIGFPASTILTVEPLPKDITAEKTKVDVNEWMAIAKTERPDLSSAYATYLQAQSLIRVADSAGRPNLSTYLDFQKTNFIHTPSLNSRVYTGSIMLNFPLFDGYLRRYQVRRAKEEAKAAFENYQDVQANVYLEVVVSYYNYETAVESLKYSDDFLRFTQESYDVTLASYREGISTIVELLNAQTALTSARTQYIQARTNVVTSLANLAFATGTL